MQSWLSCSCDEAADGAEIVAEMQIAGRLDAGKDERFEGGHCYSSWLVEGRFARGENRAGLMAENADLIKSSRPGRTSTPCTAGESRSTRQAVSRKREVADRGLAAPRLTLRRIMPKSAPPMAKATAK